jgi:uncharacterized protein (TIGR02391 family)
VNDLGRFERIVRGAHLHTEAPQDVSQDLHPFETRNIHPDLPSRVRELYDDGYFAESAFEAFKFVEVEVKRLSGVHGATGYKLMTRVFNRDNPVLKINSLLTDSHRDEQFGYMYMFAGAQSAIRNPRGHDTEVVDSPDACLDHLSIASVLIRKLDEAGLR